MILVDHQIDEFCEIGLVTPYDKELLNPASLDVRVGYSAIAETTHGLVTLDLSDRTKDDPLWLDPKEFMLVATLEVLNVPENIAGDFRLKSSRAREGYTNLLGVWIDPGYHNSVLTMELVNENRFTRLPLYPGMRIGQIVWHGLEVVPGKSYAETGRYNNDLVVKASKL